jgi:hypothetical protein
MSVHNPITSRLGHWEKRCQPTKNIPTDRVVEDPLFEGIGATLICLTARFLRLEALLGGTNIKLLNHPNSSSALCWAIMVHEMCASSGRTPPSAIQESA